MKSVLSKLSKNNGTTTTKQSDLIPDKLENGIEDMFLGDNLHPTFSTFYTLTKKLQGGSYGTVWIGMHNLRKREYAVKVVDRRYVVVCVICVAMHIICVYRIGIECGAHLLLQCLICP